MELVIGDVVELKSGGPMMTVVSVGEQVGVVWYAEDLGEFRRTEFPAACLDKLTLVEEDELDDLEDEDDEDLDDEDDEDEEEERRRRKKKK